MLENTGYQEVEDEEEAFEVEENPGLADVHVMDMWCRHSLLETEYDLFQGWLVENKMVWVYERFFRYLVARCLAGEYPGPPVCNLHRE